MVSAVGSILAEILVPLVTFVFEVALHILIASTRPWRYLFSRSFRDEVNAQHADKHPFFKWWFLIWGFVSILVCLMVIVGLIWVFVFFKPEAQPNLRTRAIEKAEQVVKDKIDKHQNSKP
jgi:hypothetical protein